MNVIDLDSRRRHTDPVTAETMPASIVPDEVLHELLRLAVDDYSQAHVHVPGSTGARHRRDLAFARLQTVGVVLGRHDLPALLYRDLENGRQDVRALARTARGWDGPAVG